jgi:hypothetical protein
MQPRGKNYYIHRDGWHGYGETWPETVGDPIPHMAFLPIRHLLQIETPALFRREFYAILEPYTFNLEVLRKQHL